MRYLAIITITILSSLSVVEGQILTLSELETICSKKNWEDVNNFLVNKGWEYFDSKKGVSTRYSTIRWSYEKF